MLHGWGDLKVNWEYLNQWNHFWGIFDYRLRFISAKRCSQAIVLALLTRSEILQISQNFHTCIELQLHHPDFWTSLHHLYVSRAPWIPSLLETSIDFNPQNVRSVWSLGTWPDYQFLRSPKWKFFDMATLGPKTITHCSSTLLGVR